MRATRLAALWCLALLPLACQAPHDGEPPAPSRPNLVLVVTDDMSWAELPHLPTVRARLVDQGVTFTNALVTTPSCSPSRVSILSGRYAHNHGVTRNRRRDGGFPGFLASGGERSTVATWLQDAGYRTLLAGKYLNWYPRRAPVRAYIPPGWSEWAALHSREDYFGFTLNDNGRMRRYGDAAEDYQTDVLAGKVLDFVGRALDDSAPFFVYLAPYAPHGPAWPAPRHEGALPDLRAPRGPGFDEEDVSDKPDWIRGLPRLSAEAQARTDDLFRRRVATLLAVDELLARLFEVLDQAGAADDTYVLFFSDNGFHLGTHRKDHGKSDPYEESIRVPLVVRGPGVSAGREVDALVANIDLAPTLVELAGLKPPGSVDGRSFARLLPGDVPTNWRTDLLVESWPNFEGATPPFRALRSAGELYVEYEGGERELYDLLEDPHQLDNRHGAEAAERLEQLGARLDELGRCAGAGCR